MLHYFVLDFSLVEFPCCNIFSVKYENKLNSKHKSFFLKKILSARIKTITIVLAYILIVPLLQNDECTGKGIVIVFKPKCKKLLQQKIGNNIFMTSQKYFFNLIILEFKA